MERVRYMSIDVDARGLACPQPVIGVKKALDSIAEGTITAIVDNSVAKEHVIKFATANNCGVSVSQQGNHYYIKITKGKAVPTEQTLNQPQTANGKLVYLISQDTLGHGSAELGGVLMKSFMFTLLERDPRPDVIMFINAGVKLTVEGSPVLEHLSQLSSHGTQVLSCGTCLDFYGLKDKLAVGSVTNMFTIVDELSSAAKAVTL